MAHHYGPHEKMENDREASDENKFKEVSCSGIDTKITIREMENLFVQ